MAQHDCGERAAARSSLTALHPSAPTPHTAAATPEPSALTPHAAAVTPVTMMRQERDRSRPLPWRAASLVP